MWLIYFLGFLFLSVIIDGEHINKEQFIESHVTRWLLRGIVIVGLSVSWLSFLTMIVLWMTYFDGFLNWEIDRDYYSIGSTSKWDIFWGKYPRLYRLFKDVMMFISTILIILNYV